MDTGTKATDRKPITSKLVCGVHKVQGYLLSWVCTLPPGEGAPYTGKCGPGSKKKIQYYYYIVSTDTFVLPGPFPLIFPCRAGGGKVDDARDTNHP